MLLAQDVAHVDRIRSFETTLALQIRELGEEIALLTYVCVGAGEILTHLTGLFSGVVCFRSTLTLLVSAFATTLCHGGDASAS